jgi:hypothetical protein
VCSESLDTRVGRDCSTTQRETDDQHHPRDLSDLRGTYLDKGFDLMQAVCVSYHPVAMTLCVQVEGSAIAAESSHHRLRSGFSSDHVPSASMPLTLLQNSTRGLGHDSCVASAELAQPPRACSRLPGRGSGSR